MVLICLEGTLTVGELVAFLAFLSLMTAPFAQLSYLWTQLAEAFAAVERAGQMFATVPETANARRVRSIGALRGHIEFRSVSFAYPRDGFALRDISFEARPGTVTALVGPSGSGKSTLINLVATFHQPASGAILVDGVDLSTLTLEGYRARLGMVLQDNFLFDGTIAQNVAFARPSALREAISEACRLANADSFIRELPDGYETMVGERGVRLSMGQRQRIAIARAVLVDPRILLLDEATSSLDSESEAAVQEALARLMVGRTTFVVAHRLATIRRADQILLIEAGRLVERGTHASLMQAGGRYRELARLQLGAVGVG